METVEVVIRIDKNDYDFLKEFGVIKPFTEKYICNVILNGTVLPKGHDDLIERAQVTNYDNLHDVPTVIEADKEVK